MFPRFVVLFVLPRSDGLQGHLNIAQPLSLYVEMNPLHASTYLTAEERFNKKTWRHDRTGAGGCFHCT